MKRILALGLTVCALAIVGGSWFDGLGHAAPLPTRSCNAPCW